MEKEQRDSFRLVLPGEMIEAVNGRKTGSGVYIRDDNAYSEVLGMARTGEYEISVIPLSGKYIPQFGDKVIGVVKEVEISGWMVDINSPYIGYMPVSEAVDEYVDPKADMSRFFDRGDVIFCRISRVTKVKSTQCSMRDMLARKLNGGSIVKVTPSKMSRIIGKSGSMVGLIKDKTGCEIFTGQNGCIWVKGDNSALAIEAIRMIDRESHMGGLTEKVTKLLEGN